MTPVTFAPIAVPLRMDEHGAIRVGDTRVLVDLVIHEFQRGATPEGIVDSYDSLALNDVYSLFDSTGVTQLTDVSGNGGRRSRRQP
jgi:uncharacterized protein (DUF433 family)